MKKNNYISWGIVIVGALILIYSFIYMQDSPTKCSTSALEIISSSFLTFGVGMAIMMIGFAKLYADRWNDETMSE